MGSFLFLVTEIRCLLFRGDSLSKRRDSAISQFSHVAEVGQLCWEVFPVGLAGSMFSFSSSLLQGNALKYHNYRDQAGSFQNSPFKGQERSETTEVLSSYAPAQGSACAYSIFTLISQQRALRRQEPCPPIKLYLSPHPLWLPQEGEVRASVVP